MLKALTFIPVAVFLITGPAFSWEYISFMSIASNHDWYAGVSFIAGLVILAFQFSNLSCQTVAVNEPRGSVFRDDAGI